MLGALQREEVMSGAARRQWQRFDAWHAGEASAQRQDLEASVQLQLCPHMSALALRTDGSPSGWISTLVFLLRMEPHAWCGLGVGMLS